MVISCGQNHRRSATHSYFLLFSYARMACDQWCRTEMFYILTNRSCPLWCKHGNWHLMSYTHSLNTRLYVKLVWLSVKCIFICVCAKLTCEAVRTLSRAVFQSSGYIRLLISDLILCFQGLWPTLLHWPLPAQSGLKAFVCLQIKQTQKDSFICPTLML